MPDPVQNEERIQALADILSLVALLGRMDKAAVQRVLLSLGSTLAGIEEREQAIDRPLARSLLAEVAKEHGERAALDMANDITFVAKAWRPVLEEIKPYDPYRLLPFAEIIFSLVNYTGVALQDYDLFEQFGGPDVVLAMPQLTAALRTYPVPRPGLTWELVGFTDPPDQALIASDAEAIYLFKAASSGITLRFSELERGSEEDARREHDVRVDRPLFAAFVAGLLGDMLYWAARLRAHTLPGHDLWQRIRDLLLPPGKGSPPAGG
ncbi:MAG TPA: hypothetical protein ENI95_09850 [Chloroflexi bacterium]|nr:hypothetical protein [Chloroflexota bacterium]